LKGSQRRPELRDILFRRGGTFHEKCESMNVEILERKKIVESDLLKRLGGKEGGKKRSATKRLREGKKEFYI